MFTDSAIAHEEFEFRAGSFEGYNFVKIKKFVRCGI